MVYPIRHKILMPLKLKLLSRLRSHQ